MGGVGVWGEQRGGECLSYLADCHKKVQYQLAMLCTLYLKHFIPVSRPHVSGPYTVVFLNVGMPVREEGNLVCTEACSVSVTCSDGGMYPV